MSTTAITAPAPLTILSQLFLSIFPLLAPGTPAPVGPDEEILDRGVRPHTGRMTPLGPGPAQDRLGPACATLAPCPGGTRRRATGGRSRAGWRPPRGCPSTQRSHGPSAPP